MRELTPSMWWRTELRIYLFQSRNVTLFHSLISFCNCQTVMSNAIEKNANIADIIARKASLMNRSSFQLYPMLCGVLTWLCLKSNNHFHNFPVFLHWIRPVVQRLQLLQGIGGAPSQALLAGEELLKQRRHGGRTSTERGEGRKSRMVLPGIGGKVSSCVHILILIYRDIYMYVRMYIYIHTHIIVSEQKLGWRPVEAHWNHCPTLKTSWGNANLWWSVLKLAPGAWRHWMCLEDGLAMKPPTTVDFELLLAAFDTWRCFLMFFVVCLSFYHLWRLGSYKEIELEHMFETTY